MFVFLFSERQRTVYLPFTIYWSMMKYRLKSASGPLTSQTFDLGETSLLGSDDSADMRLDGLDAEHARIIRRDGGLVLEAQGEARVNGENVKSVALQSGDEIQFGTCRFVLQAPGLKPVRVLEQVEREPGIDWKDGLAAAGVTLAAAAAAWWFLVGPGAGG